MYLDIGYDNVWNGSSDILGDRWLEIKGIYPVLEARALKVGGCELAWLDTNQVVIKTGDSLAPAPTRDRDVGAKLYTMTTAWIKISTF
jgi:hypothetical protein